MIVLDVVIPFLPPSNNKSYINATIKGVSRRILSSAAKEFIRKFKDLITRDYFNNIIEIVHTKGFVYRLSITTYFKDLATKTASAKNEFKRKDVLWGAKLVQDALSDLLGIDDLYHFDLILKKRETTEEEYFTLTLEKIKYSELD